MFKNKVYGLTILFVFMSTFFIISCDKNINEFPTAMEQTDEKMTLNKPGDPIPPDEVIYENTNHLEGGENSGWISYSPGSDYYTLKIELYRSVLTGGGGQGDISTQIIVKDKFGTILMDKWYALEDAYDWYTFYETFAGGCPHKMIIMVPYNFVDGLLAKITLMRNAIY